MTYTVKGHCCICVLSGQKNSLSVVTHTANGNAEGYAKLLLNEIGIHCDIEVGVCNDGVDMAGIC